MLSKTITAIATSVGESALAVIRLSGEDVVKICQPLTSINLTLLEPKKLTLCYLKHPKKNDLIDQVMICKMVAPESYTGESMIEIFSHGGVIIPSLIQKCLIEQGASLAEPGEFTQRAVIHGKIDLLTAESINQMAQARTLKELNLTHGNFMGLIGSDIKELMLLITHLVSSIDASFSFPDDVEEQELNITKQITNISIQLKDLLKKGSFSKDLQRGFRVLISGKTNVGKSSLFNALLGWERMMVSPYPSTTHDYVSERLDFEGYPVFLVDSAGWIENPNHLDKIFNETIETLMETSSIVLFVLDLTDVNSFDLTLLDRYRKENLILVFNKIDIANNNIDDMQKQFPSEIPYCVISTYTKEGIDFLNKMIVDKLRENEPKDLSYLINERQNSLLIALDGVFSTICQFPDIEKQLDMVRLELKEAVHILEQLIGQNLNEEIYNQIFSKFCIGK